ncbi:MAG: carbon-phosphorus lyase complex subunit PhnI [Rhizobiales bacterium]|nr:carbon-phosphorus lyase complex subunit PhnI [Hyphomicrobiales bacterium]
MYVAVKGGEQAIDNAHKWLAEARRGDSTVAEIEPAQIREQLSLGVGRVMSEGSLYDPDLAALALKQARGDTIEAIFLVRAYRTTLSRFGYSEPIDTGAMLVERRISATYKDLPGGQILGPTFDYTHRLIDFVLAAGGEVPAALEAEPEDIPVPHVLDIIDREGLIEAPGTGAGDGEIGDLTREPLDFPVGRDIRLQNLARADEGFLLAMGYSTQRGYGGTHPFAGEIRMGAVRVAFVPEELGFEIEIADITVTECEMVNQFQGSGDVEPSFTRGYGLVFGHGERKAMSMALVDRALRTAELGGDVTAPAQDQEFVLSHSDNVQATGFVEHLKLPHYVDFQAELELIRRLRAEVREKRARNQCSQAAE